MYVPRITYATSYSLHGSTLLGVGGFWMGVEVPSHLLSQYLVPDIAPTLLHFTIVRFSSPASVPPPLPARYVARKGVKPSPRTIASCILLLHNAVPSRVLYHAGLQPGDSQALA